MVEEKMAVETSLEDFIEYIVRTAKQQIHTENSWYKTQNKILHLPAIDPRLFGTMLVNKRNLNY